MLHIFLFNVAQTAFNNTHCVTIHATISHVSISILTFF